jgi:hypothetical protein
MKVKGTAFQARKDTVIKTFGEARWKAFFSQLAAREVFWNQHVFASTLIPDDVFLDFQDALVREFYAGDTQAIWVFGAESAEWSLTEGPYRHFLNTRDLSDFVTSVIPSLWRAYYTDGRIEAKLVEKSAHVRVKGISTPHLHYELAVMGYIEKAIELIASDKVTTKRHQGFDSEDGEIHYEFVLD